ncbi:MAG: tRNA 4-thiouridine(8) synthase ThiI [Deltaproteobacteria bacterium]|nr:tRNA 4-thiouridine(8) synthase ThiI [Deltaproteobacteria bacterium]
MSELCVVRYAEIFLKGQNRHFFEERLQRNLRAALRPLAGAHVRRLHGRMLVDPGPAGVARAIELLARVFGVASLSPALVVPPDLEALGAAALELTRVEVARRAGAPPSFKVETRRSDKRFPLQSPQVSQEIGARIVAALALPVDVHDPDVLVTVEIGVERSFVFAATIPGPGGLPVGTAGRVTALVSGGIDSPVAAWLAMKRGCEVEAVYFHSFPYTGDRTKEKVRDLCRVISAWHGPMTLWVVHFTDVQKALRGAGPAELAVVLYRRMMLRIAAERARLSGSKALVTGESLGQVASQTLDNLAVIDDAAPMPVLRPLIASDKTEIIATARRIGTYDVSVQPYDDCCSLFTPKHPATKARLQHVEAAEARLDLAALAAAAAAQAERFEVTP